MSAVALSPALHAAAGPGVAAAGWALALLWCLTWLAARHWITAWLAACILLAAAWGFILSLAFGPAGLRWRWGDPASWLPDASHDASLVLTWADPLKPWQLCAAVAGLGCWCKLVRSCRKRTIARAIRRAAALPGPQAVPVVPVWPQAPPAPPAARRGGRL